MSRNLIAEKYGTCVGEQCTLPHHGSYGVSLWKQISKGWGSFKEHIWVVVGNGHKTSFWHNVWCGERPLSSSFPTVFSLARNPNGVMANCMEGDLSLVV